MRKGWSIKRKFFLTVIILSLPGLALFYFFLVDSFGRLGENEALAGGRNHTEAYASEFSETLHSIMSPVRLVGRLMSGINDNNDYIDLNLFDKVGPRIVELQPELENLCILVDYRYLSPAYHNLYGVKTVVYRMMHGHATRSETLDTMKENPSSLYITIRNANKETTLGPYRGKVSLGDNDTHMLLSIIAPVRDKLGTPAGVVSADVLLDNFQERIKDMQPYEGTYSFLVSNRMEVVAGPTRASMGLPLQQALSNIPNFIEVQEQMQRGEVITLPFESESTREHYVLFSIPIQIDQELYPWSFCLVVPRDSLLAEVGHYRDLALILFLTITGLVLLLGWHLARKFAAPIIPLAETMSLISYGKLAETSPLPNSRKDELGHMMQSLNRLREDLIDKVHFANSLEEGNYHVTMEHHEFDELGSSLMGMAKSLLEAEERDQHQKLYEKRQRWITEGIAKFSDVIRMEQSNVGDYTYQFVSALANYTDSTVGALYLRQREEETGDLTSKKDEVYTLACTYAYEVRKFQQREYRVHEGLVGRCAAERALIYITDLPDDFVTIASGLGYSKPDALLIMPAFQNNELVGILELARFGGYEKYQIDFIQTVLNSLVSTLENFYANLQTRKLLEAAQRQGVQLQQQREEMRQNMEEMQAIQEDFSRQQTEIEALRRGLQNACSVVEYDPQGRLLRANNTYLSLLRVSLPDVMNTMHADGLRFVDHNANNYSRFWSDLRLGKAKRQVRTVMRVSGGSEVYLSETYTPITDEHGKVERVLRIAFDITPFMRDTSLQDILNQQGVDAPEEV